MGRRTRLVLPLLTVLTVLTVLLLLGALLWLWLRPRGRGARPGAGCVAYAEFLSGDGSLWRARVYTPHGRGWTVRTCYPSTGKGCGPGCAAVRYRPAAEVAGGGLVEINSDRLGLLRGLHPKSRAVDDPELWAVVSAA